MIRGEDQALWTPWLLAGERLLWAGRPKLGLVFRWADLYLVPFSLAWAVGAALEFDLLRGAPELGLVWVLPVLLVALYLFPGRFLVDAFLRSRIHYAVTNRRVLMLRSRPFAELKSVELDYLPALELIENGERGTLFFDSGEEAGKWRGEFPALNGGLHFYRIERPRLVYDLVRREAERRRRETAGEVPAHRAFIG